MKILKQKIHCSKLRTDISFEKYQSRGNLIQFIFQFMKLNLTIQNRDRKFKKRNIEK